MSTELANSASAVAIESFVTRGDWSQPRRWTARAYTHVCAQHGPNPMSQPFAFLRLNGKEVLYATCGADRPALRPCTRSRARSSTARR